MSSWQLQIYRVSDGTAQELITALLSGADALVVESVTSEFDHFVIVESTDVDEADGVHRLVRSIDPGVRLLHTARQRSAKPTAA